MRLEAIYDPQAQLACLIDTENYRALGPVAPGAEGQALLNDWLDQFPYDLEGATPELVSSLFVQWMQRNGHLPDTPVEAPQEPATSLPDPSPGTEAALAVQEAQNASGAPAPQPADTDPTATDGPTPPEPSASTSPEPPASAGSESGSGEPAPPAATSAPPSAAPEPAAPATVTQPCPACQGTGSITWNDDDGTHSNQCGMCQGTGKLQQPAPQPEGQ